MDLKNIRESIETALSNVKRIQSSTSDDNVYAEASHAQSELEGALLEMGVKFDDITGEPIA
jgi:hypothetical protein